MAANYPKPVSLWVFFGGTASSFEQKTTHIEAFGEWVRAGAPEDCCICFDGCGVTDGLLGTIFAFGLARQIQVVAERCRMLRGEEGKTPVVVNALGLSRGGCACLMLAKELHEQFGDEVGVNLMVFDPVPGNTILSSSLDLFNFSIAGKCWDLRHCSNLRRVMGLYPVEPLPDLSLHAPVFPLYPGTAQVEEEIILGCHQGAIWSYRIRSHANSLSYIRILSFLTELGAPLQDQHSPFRNAPADELQVLQQLDEFARKIALDASVRHVHCGRPGGTLLVVAKSEAEFVNRWHAGKRDKPEGSVLLSQEQGGN